MNAPIFSLIMPVYNVESYLGQCLDSILIQSLADFEVICVNDGSTDRSEEILRAYAEKDARIRVVSRENRGPALSRNEGIELAHGKFLAFPDADDFFSPCWLEKLYCQAAKTHADVCLTDSWLFDEVSGNKRMTLDILDSGCLPFRQPFSAKSVADCIFQLSNSNAWSKIYRRAFIEENGLRFQNIHNSNDLYFAYMALALAERIAYVPERLMTYRVGMSGSVQGRSRFYPTAFVEALDALKNGLITRGLFDIFADSYHEEALRACRYNFGRFTEMDLPMEKRLEILKHFDINEDEFFAVSEVKRSSSKPVDFICVRRHMAAHKSWRYVLKWDFRRLCELIRFDFLLNDFRRF